MVSHSSTRRGFLVEVGSAAPLGGLSWLCSCLANSTQTSENATQPDLQPRTFLAELTAAINKKISPLYHTNVTLIQYPSQGDFFWWFLNSNQIFNEGTYDYISARVSPGDSPELARISPAGGFPNAYLQVISSIQYVLSKRDQRALDVARMRARRLAGDVVKLRRHRTEVADILALEDQLKLGNWLLEQLKTNTRNPTAANGGMLTVNPTTGKISERHQVGYSVNTALATIANALNDTERVLELTLEVNVGKPRLVTISYPGYIMVPIGPTAFARATGVGWYDGDPIAQAVANGDRDVTGFKFVSPPGYNLGPLAGGGSLGQIEGLLVSNQPTITIQDQHGDLLRADAAGEQLARAACMMLESLGWGSSGNARYSVRFEPNRGSEGFSLVFAPEGADVSVPQLQSSAYVIGGVFNFPAVDAG